jgi:alkyl hydroperoxide reductase subunit AhpF
MCPDLVAAAQRIAAANPNVTAHVYDIHHFEHLKNQYKVMSVPCLVVNDKKISVVDAFTLHRIALNADKVGRRRPLNKKLVQIERRL